MSSPLSAAIRATIRALQHPTVPPPCPHVVHPAEWGSGQQYAVCGNCGHMVELRP